MYVIYFLIHNLENPNWIIYLNQIWLFLIKSFLSYAKKEYYIDKEYYNNIKNTNIIIPRKINACNNESLNNGSSQDKYKIKQIKKNKINIISKNKDEKEDFNISNNEINNDNKQIFDQITSKGSDEKNDEEDSKKDWLL